MRRQGWVGLLSCWWCDSLRWEVVPTCCSRTATLESIESTIVCVAHPCRATRFWRDSSACAPGHPHNEERAQLTRIHDPLLIHLDTHHNPNELHRPTRHAAQPEVLHIYQTRRVRVRAPQPPISHARTHIRTPTHLGARRPSSRTRPARSTARARPPSASTAISPQGSARARVGVGPQSWSRPPGEGGAQGRFVRGSRPACGVSGLSRGSGGWSSMCARVWLLASS